MNILFFLTPKNEVEYIFSDYSLRQALEKMEFHRYTAIPMLDRNGHYVGTLTEGDILWCIKNDYQLNIKLAEKILVSGIPRYRDNTPVSIDANIEDLFAKALDQNFIPVIDGRNIFIGIVKRKAILQYCTKLLPSDRN